MAQRSAHHTSRFLTGYTQFIKRVETLVKTIPRGRVATYGQVAALCGAPHSARQVGWILFRSVQTLPWQRVINREGRLSIVNPEVTAAQQAVLLRKEGVEVTEHDGSYWVDLQTYLWNPDRPERWQVFFAGVV